MPSPVRLRLAHVAGRKPGIVDISAPDLVNRALLLPHGEARHACPAARGNEVLAPQSQRLRVAGVRVMPVEGAPEPARPILERVG